MPPKENSLLVPVITSWEHDVLKARLLKLAAALGVGLEETSEDCPYQANNKQTFNQSIQKGKQRKKRKNSSKNETNPIPVPDETMIIEEEESPFSNLFYPHQHNRLRVPRKTGSQRSPRSTLVNKIHGSKPEKTIQTKNTQIKLYMIRRIDIQVLPKTTEVFRKITKILDEGHY